MCLFDVLRIENTRGVWAGDIMEGLMFEALSLHETEEERCMSQLAGPSQIYTGFRAKAANGAGP